MKRIKVLAELVSRMEDAGHRINHASCFLAIVVTLTFLGLPGGVVMTYA